MNLKELFEMQMVLDERIVKEHGLEGQDLLPNKILALQVELGELANEWQGFKFWKVNPQPKPNTLEEYVDNLHFILSIGLIYASFNSIIAVKCETIIDQFNEIYYWIAIFNKTRENKFRAYREIFQLFLGLGELLGFTWEQVSDAYKLKNKVNHERQGNGY